MLYKDSGSFGDERNLNVAHRSEVLRFIEFLGCVLGQGCQTRGLRDNLMRPAGQNVARDVVFCGPYEDFVRQREYLFSNSVFEKLRSFKLRLREYRHAVTVGNCWKLRLALEVITFFSESSIISGYAA